MVPITSSPEKNKSVSAQARKHKSNEFERRQPVSARCALGNL